MGPREKGGDMTRGKFWLACVVLAAVSALAATGGLAAPGNTQVDGVQTTITLGNPDDPTDDVYWMNGTAAARRG
jgi:hypothetical protein